jgi:hypothetical protein
MNEWIPDRQLSEISLLHQGSLDCRFDDEGRDAESRPTISPNILAQEGALTPPHPTCHVENLWDIFPPLQDILDKVCYLPQEAVEAGIGDTEMFS